MKKDDNNVAVSIYYIIAEKDGRVYKVYYTNYDKFSRELKYYVIGKYTCQVGVYERLINL